MKSLAGKIKTIESKTGYKKDREAYDKANKLIKNAQKVIKSKKALKSFG
ncbi:hypothetical protein [Lentilactobacillus kosonis]|uniref:Uncharacterized protein n=1 Tax=Lentilactobacillus kosonis TaxID=2810561 RepID=A0A401FPH2_9LACO|nr:hypothetical protein [Lentilactobacillus kosonis]GAY74289.1 hypothetical protein NBRC111893_2435 [Lentilactobacillus kosonis]